MNRWLRLVKHRWTEAVDVHRALPPEALERLTERVQASERGHSGEIRICIEAGLPLSYLWRGAPARERALMMFSKLRVWDTEHDNGVLIYLLLADHAIEIIADRGLHRHVGAEPWQSMTRQLGADFQAGRFEQGLAAAVDQADALLRQFFALSGGERNPNELPDQPVIIG
ncbi:MAG TPA: TPM domain-containing protein [Rubrivivax sp.]|nr:TPM domain-containing protein [Rubrivivax sp.]